IIVNSFAAYTRKPAGWAGPCQSATPRKRLALLLRLLLLFLHRCALRHSRPPSAGFTPVFWIYRALRPSPSAGSTLRLDERQQIRVDLVLMGRAQAVRGAWMDFQRGSLHHLGREQGRGSNRH